LTDTDLEEICRRRRDRNRLGLRQWIVVFLTVCAGDQAGVAAHAWIIPVVGALISFLGVPAGLIGNELSIRYGLRAPRSRHSPAQGGDDRVVFLPRLWRGQLVVV
jgi:hypothetical protein